MHFSPMLPHAHLFLHGPCSAQGRNMTSWPTTSDTVLKKNGCTHDVKDQLQGPSDFISEQKNSWCTVVWRRHPVLVHRFSSFIGRRLGDQINVDSRCRNRCRRRRFVRRPPFSQSPFNLLCHGLWTEPGGRRDMGLHWSDRHWSAWFTHSLQHVPESQVRVAASVSVSPFLDLVTHSNTEQPHELFLLLLLSAPPPTGTMSVTTRWRSPRSTTSNAGPPLQAPSNSHTRTPLPMMMMSWCLMSSDVIWHIRDKHGSIKATYLRCMRVLAVTCHLHFWQNDRDFLRATVVTRGWNGYRNKSQHRKSTLEKKILLPFQQGFEPATFQSRVQRSNHWAIPAPTPLPSHFKSFIPKVRSRDV